MNMDLEIIEKAVHDADGLYQNAAVILGYEEKTLREFKSIAERIGILARTKNLTWLCDVRRHALLIRINNLTWRHHYEEASDLQERVVAASMEFSAASVEKECSA